MNKARKLKVLAIPDLHMPWHMDLSPIYKIIKKLKPDVIIQLGDLYDLFSYSKFARSLDVLTPEEEMFQGVKAATMMWKQICKLSPRSRKIQLRGNHDIRIMKRAIERAPELSHILDKHQGDLWRFKGVETVMCDKTGVVIEDVLYVHGWLTTLGQHMRSLGVSVVHGHSHRSGMIQNTLLGKQLFELDCGYWADPNVVPLKYGVGPHMNWIHCIGWVDVYGPRIITL